MGEKEQVRDYVRSRDLIERSCVDIKYTTKVLEAVSMAQLRQETRLHEVEGALNRLKGHIAVVVFVVTLTVNLIIALVLSLNQ